MGCPLYEYRHYDIIGNNTVGNEHFFTLLKYNNVDTIGIRCGLYYEYIGEKEKALLAEIKLKNNKHIDSLNVKISVTSSVLGEFEKLDKRPDYLYVSDSVAAIIFSKKISLKREDKILKLIENDTITIEFDNGMKYHFMRRENNSQ